MDSLLKVWTKALIGENVDVTLEQCFEVLAEFNEIEQAAPIFHFNKEVDIAFRTRLPPCHRPKDPHIVSSMCLRKAQYFRPFEFE
jgi:hypothetical protein